MMVLMEDGSAVAGWVAAHYPPDALMAALVDKWGLHAVLGALEEGEKLSLPHYSQRCQIAGVTGPLDRRRCP